MNEYQEPIQLPLVAPAAPTRRAGLRCVIFGLAQYVSFLPDSMERTLCLEALDRVIMRFQGGGFEGETELFTEEERAELLEAVMGFLMMLYNLESEEGRKFILSWCRRLTSSLTAFSEA